MFNDYRKERRNMFFKSKPNISPSDNPAKINQCACETVLFSMEEVRYRISNSHTNEDLTANIKALSELADVLVRLLQTPSDEVISVDRTKK